MSIENIVPHMNAKMQQRIHMDVERVPMMKRKINDEDKPKGIKKRKMKRQKGVAEKIIGR